MSQIRVVYEAEPNFPVTLQHPDAVRYHVWPFYVDAIGGQPTDAEVEAVVATSPELMEFRTRMRVAEFDPVLSDMLSQSPPPAPPDAVSNK